MAADRRVDLTHGPSHGILTGLVWVASFWIVLAWVIL